MHVPFVDLQAQYKTIQREIEAAVQAVFHSGQYILGDNVRMFEQAAADYLGSSHAVGVGNGSDALYLALKACDIGPGCEVLTTPFSFVASSDAILRTGAKPVFVDIDEKTYNMDPFLIEERITPRTRAILPVHLYGQCANMEEVMRIAKKHSLTVIEDACQAFGTVYKGRMAGTMGNIGCFSFFPTKNLGGCGDGGMLATDDRDLAEKLRMLRVHGSKTRYHHEVAGGINSRLDEIQAAILRVKLRYIDEWNRRRNEMAAKYAALLQELPLQLPVRETHSSHIYHLFTVKTSGKPERDELIAYLHRNGVQTAVHYPVPIYLHPSYLDLGYQAGDCPIAERVSEAICSLPLYPEMTEESLNHVARVVSAFYQGRRMP
ncbi:DegT/DnrJ/EryC1/StrS family aminotransferase [Brevibacillus borstelensis]|uniref:DegT/DnrJ/EryC1/StrS family aminotransferase n=1 Tax=Brevibacillus borstelensis TaxID=45462 RepID=UPI0030C5EE5A